MRGCADFGLDGEQFHEPFGGPRGLRQLAPDFAQLSKPARGKYREQHELAEPSWRDRAGQHILRADPEDDDDARRGEKNDDRGQDCARLRGLGRGEIGALDRG